MERVLTAKEATIQTVQVEIQALKVGKKQVTMGLFRQLPLKDLIDARHITLAGVPWGYVQYWWDADGVRPEDYRRGKRLHVVWQEGNELHRSPCYEEPPAWIHQWYRKQRLPLMRKAFLLWLSILPTLKDVQIPERRAPVFSDPPAITIRGLPLEVELSRGEIAQLKHYCQWRDYEGESAWEKQQQTMAQNSFQQMLDEEVNEDRADLGPRDDGGSLSPELLSIMLQSIEASRVNEHGYHQRWAKQWQALCQLPQLFIAV